MKRSPLVRKTPLKQGGELKRTPSQQGTATLARTPLAKVNPVRAAKRRERDFGPHGNVIIPTLPCVVCKWPWWERVSDETLVAMMERALAEPDRYARVSEPAHVTHSRGAGGTASALCPLCHLHHRASHDIGRKSFTDAFPAIPFPALAARLWRLSPASEMMEEVT